MSIGNRIKKRRKEMKMSADKLAEKIGKNRATVYRYEKDEIENMPYDVLEPIAEALNVSPAYLMGWEEKEKPETVAAHLDYSDLTEEEQKEVENFIDYIRNRRK
ncbi:helix-turn-helix transcriptional regulator [Staphylococcus epidermidis]|uniref:helix-turn-helix domain-containing protein n=1 Tax=Staphylococcus epidermidis TaxID=1282 RepID=UPI00053786D9|nr:helix-turn-helix transcriptional regulator [Staphylococcus epidermidis]MBF9298733.1 helix-turn-helix transcriptional regulator [Staphylococcus schleiferi]PNO66592.1 XRE family transcriptional regulator [Staphylococcus epidermidis]